MRISAYFAPRAGLPRESIDRRTSHRTVAVTFSQAPTVRDVDSIAACRYYPRRHEQDPRTEEPESARRPNTRSNASS